MLFNSFSFLVFFPMVVFLYFVLPQRIKKIWLLIASYYFYMSWNAVYGLLILFSTIVTYGCGRWIEKGKTKGEKTTLFLTGLLLNFGILFFFKYFTWLLGEYNYFFHTEYQLPFTIILPVGISFYTFQAVGYMIDVFKGKIRAEKNFITYALFVSFFPQLVAGPIERSGHLLTQLQTPQPFNKDNATRGLQIMLWGFVEKMVIADTLALVVDQIYDNYENYSGIELLVATVLFTIQIYCDFGGYSHIAIGAAKILNVELMDNFRQPFFARSIQEHWRRWHISLSTWFRDYVYFPLGGSRCSNFRRNMNVMITFLVSGLWHGAAWHFIVWGGLHGLYQVVGFFSLSGRKKICSKLKLPYDGAFHATIQRVMTFILVVLGFIIFRADNMAVAIDILKSIVSNFAPATLLDGILVEEKLGLGRIIILIVALLLLFISDIMREKDICIEKWYAKRPFVIRWIGYYGLIFMLLSNLIQNFGESASAFLYFQF